MQDDVAPDLRHPRCSLNEETKVAVCAAYPTKMDLSSSGDDPPINKPKLQNDPLELIKLCQSLNCQNSAQLQVTINKYLQQTTVANLVFLITILNETEEAIVTVVGEKPLEHELRFGISNKIIEDLSRNDTLHPEIRSMLTFLPEPTTPIQTIPIFHPQTQQLSLLTCLLTPTKPTTAQLVQETFSCCLVTLLNTIAYEEECRLKTQCQSLLAVARNMFTRLGDLNDLLREIMSEARKLTKAERCSLFLLDPDHIHLVAKVFDGVSPSDTFKEVRITKDQGIAGQVAATGRVLNIRDAYKHPLFYKGMDETTGFKTRNILCFPIKDEKGVTIGVAQLCNKMDGLYFDVFDQEVAVAFSIYCGISIMHSLVYKKMQDAQARSKLSNELMIYHMKVSTTDIETVLNCSNSHENENFRHLCFSPRELCESETVCYVLQMYESLELVQWFNIKREVLVRFILHVKRGYRDTPYHNWWHAFTVAHFAYLALSNFELIEKGYLTKLEGLAFLTACLCHDLDHRGTNNSFQKQSGSVLASLYSSDGSVMERHHLSQAICILNTEGCNIVENLHSKDYIKFLDLMKVNILATDLAQHMRNFTQQQQLIEKGYDPHNPADKELLLSLLMSCCDLCDQTKDWPVTKRIAISIYEEFFCQGDLEKAMGTKPVEHMDREKASIPDLQIQFFNSIIIPLYSLLAKLFPKAHILVDRAIQNRNNWQLTQTVFNQQEATKPEIEILKSNDLDHFE